MSAYRSIINRMALPNTTADWELLAERLWAMLASVPLSRWQFLVRLLLVVSLAASLGRLLWMLVPSPVVPQAVVALPSQVSSHTTDNAQAANIAQLKGLNVFGKAASAPKTDAPPVIENQAVDTHLNLTLLGVMSSSDEKGGRAIISSGDKQDVYAVGQPLPVGNGVTLSKVLADRVIINNNGQYESLWLYKDDPNNRISQPYQAPPPPPQAYQYPPQPEGAPGSPDNLAPGLPQEAARSLADVVAMSIYREGGQVLGYKIRPGRDAEKFKALGLQTDDIVTAVNGTPLNNPAKIMEMYKNMGNTTSASLEIKRGGSVMTIDVVLQ